MAVVVERAPLTEPSAHEERHLLRPVLLLQCLAALTAITGMALALYFGVAPVRITVHEQVAVVQASGEGGSHLTVTDRTQTETRQVTCVPYLQFDSSSDEHPACEAKVHGRLGTAVIGLLLFLAGSAVWVL